MRLLLVEDESEIGALLRRQLAARGFVTDLVCDLALAKAALATAQFRLIILDRRLPDGDGLSLIAHIRRTQAEVAIIVVTAADTPHDAVSGLDAGADDYIAKPFDIDELLARIRAVLRRSAEMTSQTITLGRLTFDLKTHEFSIDGVVAMLPRRELALLEALILRARRVVQRDTLINDIFGFDDEIQSNTLDAHVSRLRGRLAAAGAGVVIHPVRGVGYVLDLAAKA